MRRSQWQGVLFVVLAATLTSLVSSEIAEGRARIDHSFGNRGIATVVPRSSVDDVQATQAIGQDDSGRLIVLGNSRREDSDRGVGESQMIIGRLTKRGNLDRAFGKSGFVYGSKLAAGQLGLRRFGYGQDLAIGQSGATIVGPEIQLGSSLVSNNWTTDCAFAARLNRAGRLDSGFGTQGRLRQCLRARTSRRTGLFPRSVGVTGQGKTVVGGQTLLPGTNSTGFVARYNANGTLDRSLRGDRITKTGRPGIVQLSSSLNSWVDEVRPTKQQGIVAVGTTHGELSVARVLRNGKLDSDFASRGLVRIDIDRRQQCQCSIATGVDFDRQGRLLVSGRAGSGRGFDYPELVVLRFLKSGHLDRSFGNDGMVRPKTSGFFGSTGIAIQRNGRIVVSGTLSEAGRDGRLDGFALIRLTTSGKRDPSFFRKGLFAGRERRLGGVASDLLVDRRGRIVASGEGGDFSVVRILPGH